MTAFAEPEVTWSRPNGKVTLNEPDDFLKVRETLTRIGWPPVKKKDLSVVLVTISKVDITLYTSKSYSR